MADPQVTSDELEHERGRRRAAETEAELLKAQLEHARAELKRCQDEVRYQLADALVRAARPSLDTLKLPVRLVQLLAKGLRRRRARCQAAMRDEAGPGAAVPTYPQRPTFRPHPLVTQPFGRAPPELRRCPELRIALVADEFSWWAWQFEADVYTFTPASWQAALEEQPPHLLLVDSAWRGPGESWRNQVRDLGVPVAGAAPRVLPAVVAWCRRRGVPTVFYNKEDPSNFEVFLETAKLFDFVFTSDANRLEAYRRRLGHDRVFALPFAAQPRLHNPVLSAERIGNVCFAGTWYAHRHLGRHDAGDAILRPALDFGLHILDRMSGSADPDYQWPEAYGPALRGGVPYAEMLDAYKRYKVFLNVNSVANSPTMFSRRVFELLACGTPVVGSYSEGIAELLGADLVLMSQDEATTRRHLERLLGDDDYRERLALRGQRTVFAEHTYAHRLETLLRVIGMDVPPLTLPGIAFLAPVSAADGLPAVADNYRRQAYDRKSLVVCAESAAVAAKADAVLGAEPGVTVVRDEGGAWGRLAHAAVRRCESDYVAVMRPGDYYGPHYLTDYAHATLYVHDAAIGKAAYYAVGEGEAVKTTDADQAYRYVAAVSPWTLCLPRKRAAELADKLAEVRTAAEWWPSAVAACGRVYAADRFNYVWTGARLAPAVCSAGTPAAFSAAVV